MIMGEKIKHLEANADKKFRLTQLELSSLMIDKCLDFYKMETIQDIIQIQWKSAKKFTVFQFRIYYIFFFIPYLINLLCNERVVRYYWPLPPIGSALYFEDEAKR